MHMRLFLLLSILTAARPVHAFLGTELGPLLQLVSGQVRELERLAEQVGLAKEQRDLLIALNSGIDRTVQQIQAIQSIADRAKGLDPKAVRSLADLNELLERAKSTKVQVEELLGLKIMATNQAIEQSALQSDTAYKMGQEMVKVGSGLAGESQFASPGRATQISAASGSAQMLAKGVELQTLSQLVQLQAMSLELQKTQLEKELISERSRRAAYEHELEVIKSRGRK